MYIGYDVYEGAKVLCWPWDWEECYHPNLDCNVSVWMVPGTLPEEGDDE